MKKIPTYTLIRRTPIIGGEGEGNARVPKSSPSGTRLRKKTISERIVVAGERAIFQKVSNKRLKDVYSDLNENFKATLRSSHVNTKINNLNVKVTASASENVKKITKELAREANVLRVGIVDMGTWIGELPKLLDRLNAAQSIFTMFEVMAPVPAGLVKTLDGFMKWAHAKNQPDGIDFGNDAPTSSQIIFDDFVVAAEDIRQGMGLDLLIGLTPHMLGGWDGEQIFANHFAATEGASSLISTADLREFSANAERPFEVGVGMLLVATLFVTITPAGYHPINTGCIFDYNKSRVSLVDSIRALQIDLECQALMAPHQVLAAKNMLKALKRMKLRKAR